MNNHRQYLIKENDIEYHALECILSEKNDEKRLNKFTLKYEYVIIIDSDYLKTHKRYYKDGILHNIHGAADVYSIVSTKEIIQEYYYLNGVGILKNEWFTKIRKYKLQNLSLVTVD